MANNTTKANRGDPPRTSMARRRGFWVKQRRCHISSWEDVGKSQSSSSQSNQRRHANKIVRKHRPLRLLTATNCNCRLEPRWRNKGRSYQSTPSPSVWSTAPTSYRNAAFYFQYPIISRHKLYSKYSSKLSLWSTSHYFRSSFINTLPLLVDVSRYLLLQPRRVSRVINSNQHKTSQPHSS